MLMYHGMSQRRDLAWCEDRALVELPGMAKEWCYYEAGTVDRNVWNRQIDSDQLIIVTYLIQEPSHKEWSGFIADAETQGELRAKHQTTG